MSVREPTDVVERDANALIFCQTVVPIEVSPVQALLRTDGTLTGEELHGEQQMDSEEKKEKPPALDTREGLFVLKVL